MRKVRISWLFIMLLFLVGVGSVSAQTLLFEELFASESVGNIPLTWEVNNLQYHLANGSGPRVATDIPDAPDNVPVLKYTNGPRDEGAPKSEGSIMLPEVNRGRLEFSVYQPEEGSSNFGIKPFRNSDRLVDFWLSGNGALRLPEKDGEAIGKGVWHTFAFEWDGLVLKVYQLKEGVWEEKSPEGGYSISGVPNRLFFDGASVDGADTWGALGNIKMYSLD